MRVINTFFLSLPLGVVLVFVKPPDVGGPGLTLSDVKDCASLLLRMLDLPNEPSPAYDPDVNVDRDSDGRM
jgi:hypothetical protein